MKKFGLSAEEKIKSRKDFEAIYANGKSLFSSGKNIKAVFLHEKNEDLPGVQVAAAVSRKSGNAVWRNRVKRLIKESYRLNKLPLVEKCKEKKIRLKIVFSPFAFNQRKNKTLKLSDVLPGVNDILLKLLKSI